MNQRGEVGPYNAPARTHVWALNWSIASHDQVKLKAEQTWECHKTSQLFC